MVKGPNLKNAETERDIETDPISEVLSPLCRHGGHGPEGKPFSHLGRRSRKKNKKGGSLPLSPGGARTSPGPSSCDGDLHQHLRHLHQHLHHCWCQNRRISGRGSRTMRLGSMVTRDRGHNVYPGSGPLYGGNTLLPPCLILMNMSVTRVDLPRDRND